MSLFERIENIRKEKGISQGRLEKELGFSNGSVSKWKNSTPTTERLQKVADYFEVSLDYLINGKEDEGILTREEKIDIAKDMEKYSNLIKNKKGGPLYFNGKEIDEETKNLFLHELESALTSVAMINRVKND